MLRHHHAAGVAHVRCAGSAPAGETRPIRTARGQPGFDLRRFAKPLANDLVAATTAVIKQIKPLRGDIDARVRALLADPVVAQGW
ncbi:MAG TPA: hypothetical protein VJ757_07260 [Pseudonocardiaceae bacterium]|nr:hypothetical protein [Pseudonocardiaceae bacterium]